MRLPFNKGLLFYRFVIWIGFGLHLSDSKEKIQATAMKYPGTAKTVLENRRYTTLFETKELAIIINTHTLGDRTLKSFKKALPTLLSELFRSEKPVWCEKLKTALLSNSIFEETFPELAEKWNSQQVPSPIESESDDSVAFFKNMKTQDPTGIKRAQLVEKYLPKVDLLVHDDDPTVAIQLHNLALKDLELAKNLLESTYFNIKKNCQLVIQIVLSHVKKANGNISIFPNLEEAIKKEVLRKYNASKPVAPPAKKSQVKMLAPADTSKSRRRGKPAESSSEEDSGSDSETQNSQPRKTAKFVFDERFQPTQYSAPSAPIRKAVGAAKKQGGRLSKSLTHGAQLIVPDGLKLGGTIKPKAGKKSKKKKKDDSILKQKPTDKSRLKR